MERSTTSGTELLGTSGLVAFMACGHWWVYPVHVTSEQMHDLARFNLGITCSFCLAEWRAATHVYSTATTSRIN